MDENKTILKAETSLFKWAVGILISVVFVFIGIIYGQLTMADNQQQTDIKEIKSHESTDAEKFTVLNSNVFHICKSLRVDCQEIK